jgi:hypothetical protein
LELFDIALAHGDYTHIDVAVAYATFSGVHVLEKMFKTRIGDQWERCTVEKLGSRRSPLTIEGVGQHLEGGFLEEVGGLAGQQG